MKTLVIKSNNGNHNGFNRTWELLSIVDSKKEAKEELAEWAAHCVDGCDGWIERNGRMWNTYNQEYLYTNNMDSFNEDGCSYCYVTEKDCEDFFNGTYNGYMPKFVKEHFNIED